jgi:hypothetical protein
MRPNSSFLDKHDFSTLPISSSTAQGCVLKAAIPSYGDKRHAPRLSGSDGE